ncbi:hypothetical protein GGR51DRAFT_146930 [Nemania sp. FL0031]|nr:hypothetical protein GGR51DRAFT_146930 [Nemania sp. FL0031]
MDTDILEDAHLVLSTVTEAIQAFKKGGDSSREWKSDLRFCSTLQSTLEDILAWHPSDENFAHHFELELMIREVSCYLQSFSNILTPCIPALQETCKNRDSKQDIDLRESQLKNSVSQPVRTLRNQVHRYLQAINTLLLLYIIAIFSSPPLELMPEEQLSELQTIGQRARVLFTRDLDQPRTIEEQQTLLNSMRWNGERHWKLVQLTIHGAWGDAAQSSGDDSSSVPESHCEVSKVTGSDSHQVEDEKSSILKEPWR